VSMLPLRAVWPRVPLGPPAVLGLVDELVAVHDEPVATATWLSHHLLCRQVAREGFTALLGGLGGDELNAGEYEYFPFHFADLRAQGREAELAHEVERWAAHHDHPIHRKGPEQAEAMLARLTDPARPGTCLPDAARFTRYASLVSPELADPRLFEPVMEHPFADCLRNRAWQDLSRETLPCCLRAEDRDAAALGLGHALPFLDHRLVELMFRVPGDRKIADGVTKRLLREAMRGILPEETRSRVKKTGWNAPAHVWFGGEGAEAVLDRVRSRSFADHGVYDPAAAERLVREHAEIVRSGEARESHMMAIWQLVNLEAWLSLLDRERAAQAGRPALAA
ncbi:MAG: asparagine synthase-related protein, partial [Thermoleophilia bacterium]